jgi:Polyketide cyclase / dehydrase and lipid transport
VTTSTHQLEQRVSAGPAAARALLADPNQLPKLHPLIERVTVLRQSREDDAEVTAFELFEHVPMGPFRVPNTYLGWICRPDDAARLTLKGESTPGVRIHADFEFVADPEGTLVRETLRVTVGWLLHHFVAKTAVDAHRRQLAALATYFAAQRT